MSIDGGEFVSLSSGGQVSVGRKRQRAPGTNDEDPSSGPPLIEKVNNVWGSTAGAGSDFFHTYRKHRAVEMERLKQMDESYEEEQEELKFQERRENLARLNEERAVKAAAKREKLKQRRKRIKEVKQQGEQINNFNNDGTFLSQFLCHHNENEATSGATGDDVKHKKLAGEETSKIISHTSGLNHEALQLSKSDAQKESDVIRNESNSRTNDQGERQTSQTSDLKGGKRFKSFL